MATNWNRGADRERQERTWRCQTARSRGPVRLQGKRQIAGTRLRFPQQVAHDCFLNVEPIEGLVERDRILAVKHFT
jgi:hypothetical protein